jgi:hypothetical protein
MPITDARRAGAFRHRAHQLTEQATREWREDRRRHLLELAATYQRTADALAPPPPRARAEQHHCFFRPDRGQSRCRCAGHLRPRPAAACLCRFARHVGSRSACALAYAGNRHTEVRCSRIASASCQHSGPGAVRARAGDTRYHRIVALGGFYFSLMPSLVRVATGVTSPIVGGLVVSALTFSGAIAVLTLRNASARRILSGGIPALVTGVAITLAGVQTQHVSLMLIGTIVAGIGFGAAFSGSMRTVMPQCRSA